MIVKAVDEPRSVHATCKDESNLGMYEAQGHTPACRACPAQPAFGGIFASRAIKLPVLFSLLRGTSHPRHARHMCRCVMSTTRIEWRGIGAYDHLGVNSIHEKK